MPHSTPNTAAATLGQAPFTYAVVPNWAKVPQGISWKEVAGVATDADDRVYVFARGDQPIVVFEPDGTFVRAWGEGLFTRPHGITIDSEGFLYCTDDLGHAVYKFTTDGRLMMTLGTPGQPSDTGATDLDYRKIRRAGPPFHYPTNVAFSPSGEIYVSDGYGNARVHKFAPDGRLLGSWGEPGAGPGQFHLPHGIAVDTEGRVYVADRENSRIQIFSPDGEFLEEWPEIARPCQLAIDPQGNVFVAEVGYRAGLWPGQEPPFPNAPGGRASVLDRTGRVLSRWGGGGNPTAPGDFYAPHDICIDSKGDVYVGEVIWSAGANRGLISPECHSLQKFVRVSIE